MRFVTRNFYLQKNRCITAVFALCENDPGENLSNKLCMQVAKSRRMRGRKRLRNILGAIVSMRRADGDAAASQTSAAA